MLEYKTTGDSSVLLSSTEQLNSLLLSNQSRFQQQQAAVDTAQIQPTYKNN